MGRADVLRTIRDAEADAKATLEKAEKDASNLVAKARADAAKEAFTRISSKEPRRGEGSLARVHTRERDRRISALCRWKCIVQTDGSAFC